MAERIRHWRESLHGEGETLTVFPAGVADCHDATPVAWRNATLRRGLSETLNLVLASASGIMFCFFMRLMVLVSVVFRRRACRLGSQTTNRFFNYSRDIAKGPRR